MKLTQREQKLLDGISKAFSCFKRPEKMTLEDGDLECKEHDKMWRSRDPDSLSHRDVFQPCSWPWNELLTQGRLYFLPAIARLVLRDKSRKSTKWSGLYFVGSMLNSQELIDECNREQRDSIIHLIDYFITEKLDARDCRIFQEDFEYVREKWKRQG